MWKGTAEILKAKPTSINTIPNVNPYWLSFIIIEISSKFVVPEKPYINEQPYNKSPEDKALKTKYFKPDSEDERLFLLNEARTYNANDCNSNPT